ncbi:MAG TPA: CoA pyrophosphatase [Syntrophorhabdaceae bacterium]|nr:CoA pyrophosphatase [Syntrophorhabdaceae bacterium]HPP06062.1 CoA pyrophosphatase [Syntrophorhabdaceae bacterium]
MIEIIREKLKYYEGKRIEGHCFICAGVIIPLFEHNNEVFIVLTKRSDKVRFHKAEVSFPGGMCEDYDNDTLNTALRECCEEIGVKKHDVEILGRLDDMITLTGFVITPYVGVIPYPYRFKTNPDEVAYLIFFPIKMLMEAKPEMESADHEGRIEMVPSIYYNGDRIWGATCRILLRLRHILEDGKV